MPLDAVQLDGPKQATAPVKGASLVRRFENGGSLACRGALIETGCSHAYLLVVCPVPPRPPGERSPTPVDSVLRLSHSDAVPARDRFTCDMPQNALQHPAPTPIKTP